MTYYCVLLHVGLSLFAVTCPTDGSDCSSSASHLSEASLRAAIERAVPRLEEGARGSSQERQCFTCHSQGLPVFALTEAARRGLEIDRELVQQQLEHTWKHLERGQSAYLQGKGQGGQVMTAGYALWTLEAGGWPSDKVTESVASYLLGYQRERQHWGGICSRPPSSGSSFTSTYLALRGLSYYGSAEQQAELQERREAAAKWVLHTLPQDTEDRVFQLRTLPYIAADEATIGRAVQALLDQQADNGGWAQTSDMQPDAYATGSVLSALHDVSGLTLEHAAFARGCRYLLDSQLPDGTWHVATHAPVVQEYFESGFPHGKDQFISVAATGWAVLALAQALPLVVVAQPPAPPQLIVKHCQDFQVNGQGDAEAWNATQWVPLNRRPKAAHDYSARFKMLYSDKGLYVLFDGSDRRLTATLQEDFLNLYEEDVYECFFWTDETHPIYFEYEISPLGFELPILIPNFDGSFFGWRPWHYEGDKKTIKQVSAEGGTNTPNSAVTGWRAEVFFPYGLLQPLKNVPPTSGTKWRANFYRVDYDPLPDAASEKDAKPPVTQWDWARVGPSFHEYQKYGTLVFE